MRSLGFYATQEEADDAKPHIIPDDTIVLPQVSKIVITFECFCQLWKREFPHLHVRSQGEDTRTTCFQIKNRMRFLLNKKQTIEKRLDCIDHTSHNTSDSTPGNTNDITPVNISKELEDFSTGECPETESEPRLETYDETTPEDSEELIK